MARIQITIDIPKDGPAQVSITSDHQAVRPASSPPQPRPLGIGPAITQSREADHVSLRATRESRGWTQRELAERIGCSVGTIALVEQGRKPMSDRIRARIKNAGIVLTGPSANGSGSHDEP